MDIKSPEERSRNMAKIKNANTKPEMHIRSLLHRQGFRFRVNYKKLPGKPDIYFPGKKVAVFIHGCYWHRHEGCKYAYTPKTNVEFWTTKLERNREHDREVTDQLNGLGIRVLTIWECAIAVNGRNDLSLVKSFEEFLEGDALSGEV
jgi:DNA mismatch endonuclease (patch repair protein)